ncbi:hypothetical protein [Rahnella victoriana]|uniref:Acid shock protein n=1 Tax=Rahnella victoriana TaxID=1510570 RepID=A0ABS0DPN0_9GAMM|nr:hypothetical protein [Rahnella victoriana]MBF7955846.1 hypothetical protein [Rahnella victoriana]
MNKSGMLILCASLLAASLSANAEGPHKEPVKPPQPVHQVHKPVVKHKPVRHKAKPAPVHHKVQPKPEVKPQHRG